MFVYPLPRGGMAGIHTSCSNNRSGERDYFSSWWWRRGETKQVRQGRDLHTDRVCVARSDPCLICDDRKVYPRRFDTLPISLSRVWMEINLTPMDAGIAFLVTHGRTPFWHGCTQNPTHAKRTQTSQPHHPFVAFSFSTYPTHVLHIKHSTGRVGAILHSRNPPRGLPPSSR